MKKYVAELVGTFWLVLGGCGSAVLAAGFPDLGIGFLSMLFHVFCFQEGGNQKKNFNNSGRKKTDTSKYNDTYD